MQIPKPFAMLRIGKILGHPFLQHQVAVEVPLLRQESRGRSGPRTPPLAMPAFTPSLVSSMVATVLSQFTPGKIRRTLTHPGAIGEIAALSLCVRYGVDDGRLVPKMSGCGKRESRPLLGRLVTMKGECGPYTSM